MKKIVLLLSLVLILSSGYRSPEKFRIDAVTNASKHNTLGTTYLQEHCYYAAIQEFKIAISLNPNTQASAVYYNNLGETYMKVGFPKYAEDCFERAIKLYGLNFRYYQNLAACYKRIHATNKMLSKYKAGKNPLDKIMLGLLYEGLGDNQKAIMTLDDFCMSEPDLIITQAVRLHLQELTKK